jgi:glutamate dehydrogenase/leucine dehydrogenase
MVRDDIAEDFGSLSPQSTTIIRDDSIGLLGYIVIDASVDGRACGGLRISRDITVEQISALAHGMTLKYGFSGMAQGGAKAGILEDADAARERKWELLRRFGQIAGPLLRTRAYISGPDMGSANEDIAQMLAAAGTAIPKPRRHRGLKSGLYTAMGVMVAVEACGEAQRMTLAGKTVAIEGFGSVGSALADLLVRRHGMTIVAVSTSRGALYNPAGLDIDELLRLRGRFGNDGVTAYERAERIPHEELKVLDVDVFSPCAGQFSITMENAGLVKARLVVPGANNPVTSRAERVLQERGILSVPYFAANCGGVLGNKAEVLGISEEAVEAFLRRKNRGRIVELIAEARSRGMAMMPIAEAYALRRFKKVQEAAGRAHPHRSLRGIALSTFNAGVIPEAIVRSLAPAYLSTFLTNDPPVGGGDR